MMLTHLAPVNDPLLNNVIWVPSPGNSRVYVPLYTSPSTIRALRDGNRNVALGEYCGLIHGKMVDPATDGLAAAYALFRGIKRPMKGFGEDSDIYAYVLNPAHSYEFPEDTKHSGKGAQPLAKPKNAVFVVYAEMKSIPPEITANLPEDIQALIVGGINYWEWVLASSDNPTLPENYASRYHEKVW